MIVSLPDRRHRVVVAALLLLSAAYFISLSLYISARRLMWADEFLAWYLITDPSWRHAVESWNQAVDSGGPLFYPIARLLVFLFGPHPVVIRLFSAGCLWLSAILWFDLLRKKFSTGSALFTVALIWLCDPLFIYYLGEVRFYGQLVLAVTLAARALIWIEDHGSKTLISFFLMLSTGCILVTSHMLGAVYAVVFLVAIFLSRLPSRNRAAAAGGMGCSLFALILFRNAVKAGSDNYSWVEMPHWIDLVRFFLHTPIFYPDYPAFSRLANILMYLLIGIGAYLAARGTIKASNNSGQRLLLLLSCLLLLVPTGFFIVSHVYKPIWVQRYFLPYDLGLACLGSWALWLISKQPWYPTGLRYKYALYGLAGLFILGLHTLSLQRTTVRPYSNIAPYLAPSPSIPLVLEEADLFQEARYYGGPSASHIYYVLLPLAPGTHSTFDSVLNRGYQSGLAYDDAFFAANPTFLYLDIPRYRDYFLHHEMRRHPEWRISEVGSLPYYNVPTRLLKIER